MIERRIERATTSPAFAARGKGWSAAEVVCERGPADEAFEERHHRVSIAVVVEGSFHYRTDTGKALLYPGSIMLGNPGACFECGHEHAAGDRCVAFHFDADIYAEIAANVAGSDRFRFTTAMLPAMQELAAPVVSAALLRGGDAAAAEEVALEVAARVVAVASGALAADPATASDERRISIAVRHIEANAGEPFDLGELARVAALSKFHFIRSFRRVTGVTPLQFTIGARLRRAALSLRQSTAPVSEIAFDSGFGDLSTFNRRFRDVFGVAPGQFRKRA